MSTEELNEVEALPPQPTHCALLNEGGVFVGMTEIPPEPTALHLLEVTECDLPAGKYRWDGTKFVPLPKSGAETAMKEPSTIRAIAKGFMALRDSGVTLPEETLNWLAWFSTSMDGN